MTLKPLADRVILKAMEAQETTKGGIILTASAKEKPGSPASTPALRSKWTARSIILFVRMTFWPLSRTKSEGIFSRPL